MHDFMNPDGKSSGSFPLISVGSKELLERCAVSSRKAVKKKLAKLGVTIIEGEWVFEDQIREIATDKIRRAKELSSTSKDWTKNTSFSSFNNTE